MTRPARAALLALGFLGLAAPVSAQTLGAGDQGLAFSLGAGVTAVPDYFGSDEATVGPDLAFDLGYVGVGPLSFGDPDFDAVREGWGLRGSFRYVPERDGATFAGPGRLADSLDRTLEVGGGLRYARPSYEAFAVARYGFGGSDAVVGEVGLDLIARPGDRLTLRAGPRLLLGSDDYADYYFSTPDGTSAPGGGFDATGGLLSSGVEAGVTYQLSDRLFLEGTARYDRLQNDAADSPVTAEDDQLSAGIALTRRFSFAF